MYYHRLPPEGSESYECGNGLQVSKDFDSFEFVWDKFVDKLGNNVPEESIKQVANYIFFASVAIHKDYGTGGYAIGETEEIVSLIQAHYDCLAKRHVFTENDFYANKDEIIELISNELQHNRPMMFYIADEIDFGHATVIDGYRENGGVFYVHINMGLNGFLNGWYELFKNIMREYDDMYYREIITIHPK